MNPLPIVEVATAMEAVASGVSPDLQVGGFALDSREVRKGDLFLCVKGEREDGHDYAEVAMERGAIAVVAERGVQAPSLRVDNLVQALWRMGRFYRDRYGGLVVGVSGSAGKTTTKEFLASALAAKGPVRKTEGNRNTEYTAPLIWPEVAASDWAVVTEFAMRGFGQIAHLAGMAKPFVGVITNVGYSHAELVGSREGVAKAKGELLEALPTGGLAVLWREDEFHDALKARCPCAFRTFGFSEDADSRIEEYRQVGWDHCDVKGAVAGRAWEASLPVLGRHIALDAAAAMLVAVALGVPVADAAARLPKVQLPPLRMEIRDRDGATVLLDAYNASPASMIAALEVLTDGPASGRRLAVVGEMRELGDLSVEGHAAVGSAIARLKLDEVLFFGPETDAARRALAETPGGEAVKTATAATIDEVKRFVGLLRPGDALLLKGSRALGLEEALQ